MRSGEIDVWWVDLRDSNWDCCATRFIDAPGSSAAAPRTLESRRARAALRHLLARYLACRPESLILRTGPHGRPEIDGAEISFNLSHSGGRALLAFSTDTVGADLECMDQRRTNPDELLEVVAHPLEIDSWHRDATDDHWARFCQLWVRKEVYAKALGFGLSRSFASYRMEACGRCGFRVVDEEHLVGGPMYVHDLPAWKGFAAAICTPFTDPLISSRVLAPDELDQWR